MRKDQEDTGDEELGPLVDTTEALTLRSKRTARAQKRKDKKRPELGSTRTVLDLPLELTLYILSLLRPSDVLELAQVDRRHHAFVGASEPALAAAISRWRYGCLARCFPLPVLLADVDDAEARAALQHDERRELLAMHRKPYHQHVPGPDAARVCTCLTCVLRWTALCIAVDFAHWQPRLDAGEPLPVVARGDRPAWNEALLAANADKVWRALRRPLWHARLLEAHLDSTVRSIRRHAANRGNRRRRFAMAPADAASAADAFLDRPGPPTLDFPFHRDAYYMLEAYLPNRAWNGDAGRWVYVPLEQHHTDLAFVVAWARRRRTPKPQDQRPAA